MEGWLNIAFLLVCEFFAAVAIFGPRLLALQRRRNWKLQHELDVLIAKKAIESARAIDLALRKNTPGTEEYWLDQEIRQTEEWWNREFNSLIDKVEPFTVDGASLDAYRQVALHLRDTKDLFEERVRIHLGGRRLDIKDTVVLNRNQRESVTYAVSGFTDTGKAIMVPVECHVVGTPSGLPRRLSDYPELYI